MFAWFRKWLSGGEVPQRPDDADLDFPEDEEWVFDKERWKWVAQDRPDVSPYQHCCADDGPVEVDVFEEEEPVIQLGVHESVPESRCCGGHCQLNHKPGE